MRADGHDRRAPDVFDVEVDWSEWLAPVPSVTPGVPACTLARS